MNKKWAVFNMSGGVGKSTMTQNLGYYLATEQGARVLLLDFDPQASLTTFMGKAPTSFSKTVANSMLDLSVPLPIEEDFSWCHLAPTNIYLAQCEIKLGGVMQKETRLKQVLSHDTGQYDITIIDCPPSLGQLAINCLAAADNLLIPIQTEYKSVEATINLLQMTFEITRQINPELKVFGVMPTMFDGRVNSHKEAVEMIKDVFERLRNNPLFSDTIIFDPVPRGIDFAAATRKHIPLALYKKNHPALPVLSDISSQIGKTLNLREEVLISG